MISQVNRSPTFLSSLTQSGSSVCLHYRSLVSDPEPSPPAPIGTSPGRWVGLYRQLRSPSRLRTTVDYLALALLSFIPMLASRPGVVTDDTKTYLYLDPGRYVRQATSLWDPSVALGTVTHENIGYLLPMGPFYWLLAELHVQLWVAQRLWMGVLLFAAGAGTLYLCRVIGLTGPGRYVASIGFMFTPYVLQYAGRISAILMPWAGLPWLVAFVILALRRGGWRYPALFALAVALVSGINASSIIYVGIAPVVWLLYSVLIAREASWRRVWGVAWRVGLLSGLVSLWWAIGLQVEAAYGVNVLKYTETVPVTSSTSLASEVIRGLGYWYFYGSDRVGSWTQASVAYTQNLWLVGLSFAVPVLALAAAVLVKWRRRAYFVLLVVIGMVLSVGAYPFTHPSGVGALLKAVIVDTTAGLAMRSTDRASPLVILGLAVLLGAGVTAAVRRVRRTGLLIGAFAVAAIAGASTPLWTGSIIAHGFTQPATPPTYVRAASAALNKTHPGTRVYALPGNDFAAYRWGDTIDTVYPGLLTRPFVTHEQQIMGSLPTADLLQAIDSPLQGGTEDWNALGADGVVDECGRRAGAVRPGLRALQHPEPPAAGPRSGRHPTRALQPGILRRAGTQRLTHRLPRRGRLGPTAEPAIDLTAGVLHRQQSAPGRPGRVPLGSAGGRRQRHRSGQRRLGGAVVGEPHHLLRRIAGYPTRPPAHHPREAGQPGGHRHQPQAVVRVDVADRQHRVHPNRQRGPGHHQPE